MPENKNLTATTTVDRTPDEVFAAITDVRAWWNENLIGHSAELHDEFVFTDDFTHAGETAQGKEGIRFARFRLTEVEPGKRMVWHCVDSELTFVDDHDEWTGTDVVFEISATEDGTTVQLTHVGLTPAESACFEACSAGWTFYLTQSLPRLITTGAGSPIERYHR